MILKFFKPAYYSKYYIVDDLMDFLSLISEYFNDKEYSPIIHKLMIGPIIAPDEIIKSGLWAESIKCWPKSHDASVSKQIDYNDFINSSLEGKRALLIINLLESVKSIKSKGKFNYLAFKKDIINFCVENDFKYIVDLIS